MHPKSEQLRNHPSDGYLLFSTRIVRLFAYGFLSVVLVLYRNFHANRPPEETNHKSQISNHKSERQTAGHR